MSGKIKEGKNNKKEIDREMDRTNRLSPSPLSLYRAPLETLVCPNNAHLGFECARERARQSTD
jgi:hypothetical protein